MARKERRLNFAKWRMNLRRLIKYENRLFEMLKKLFARQEKEVLKNLWKVRNKLPKKALGYSEEDYVARLILFDDEEWTKIFSDSTKPIIGTIVAEAGQDAINTLNFNINFNQYNKNIIKYIDNIAFRFAKDLNKNTILKLTPSLKEALKDGESIELIRLRIQKIFDGTIRGTAPRARLIARTETLAADNGGRTLGAEQLQKEIGAEIRKGWVTSRDKKVRKHHISAGKRYGTKLRSIPLHKKFRIGTYWCMQPGDMALGVEERVNCRCTTIQYVIRKRGRR